MTQKMESNPRYARLVNLAITSDLVADGPADPDDDGRAWEVFEDRDAVERQMTDQIRISVAANHGIQIPVEAPVDPVR